MKNAPKKYFKGSIGQKHYDPNYKPPEELLIYDPNISKFISKTKCDIQDTPDFNIINNDKINEIRCAIDTLTDRQKNVIIKYYGLGMQDEVSVVDICYEMSITRDRLYQILRNAIKNLSKKLNNEHNKIYSRDSFV